MQHMTTSNIELGYVDKRKSIKSAADEHTRLTTGVTVFTANAGGTTTTLVGANAAPGTNDNNVIRRGEKFRLFNSSGALKEETVFEVTGVAVAASTTVTFAPAATGATASGDFAKLVGMNDIDDIGSLDDRLTAINSTSYSASRLDSMSVNDKIWALRQEADAGGI